MASTLNREADIEPAAALFLSPPSDSKQGENTVHTKIAQAVVDLLTPKITQPVDKAVAHGLEQFHSDIRVTHKG